MDSGLGAFDWEPPSRSKGCGQIQMKVFFGEIPLKSPTYAQCPEVGRMELKNKLKESEKKQLNHRYLALFSWVSKAWLDWVDWLE